MLLGFVPTFHKPRSTSTSQLERDILLREVDALKQQVKRFDGELTRIQEADGVMNLTSLAGSKGRGKKRGALFSTAAALLKDANPLPPSQSEIDQYKARFETIPKELLDFPGLEPDFMKIWPRLQPYFKECQTTGQYPKYNNMIGILDYCIDYCFVRAYQPKVVIEVGSGYSTRAIYRALKENKIKNGANETEQVCRHAFVCACIPCTRAYIHSTYVRSYFHARMQIFVCVRVCVFLCVVCVCACVYVRARSPGYIYCVCTYIYVYIHTHTYKYTFLHTYVYIQVPSCKFYETTP